MVARVRRESRIASAATRRSPRTRVRSLASIATSVPVPIARPRSAWASAAASLTPSPTIATTRPSACSRFTTSTLSAGSTPATTSASSMPTSAATARATASWSPVSSIGRSPRSRNRRTASAEVGLTASATDTPAPDRAVPGHLDDGVAGGPLDRTRRPPDDHLASLDRSRARRTPPRPGSRRPAGRCADPRRGPGRDRAGDRVLGGVLDGSGQPQHLVGVLARGSVDVRRASSRPVVTVPVLSSTIVSTRAGRLEHLGSLDEDAELGAAAGADHQGGRASRVRGRTGRR